MGFADVILFFLLLRIKVTIKHRKKIVKAFEKKVPKKPGVRHQKIKKTACFLDRGFQMRDYCK
jgi:hypothetical protein